MVTSSVNRVIPVGTELTVPFDFDYTACHYPVRCACGRGAPLCAVADWFRHHHHLTSHLYRRDCSDTDERHRRQGDGNQVLDDYSLSDDNEAVNYAYEHDSSPRNRNHHVYAEKARSRIPVKYVFFHPHLG